MQKIEKFLRKLSKEERLQVKLCIKKILTNNLENINLKKLKGRDDIFRVRVGKIRIIYRKLGGLVSILSIERRNDNTYGKY